MIDVIFQSVTIKAYSEEIKFEFSKQGAESAAELQEPRGS